MRSAGSRRRLPGGGSEGSLWFWSGSCTGVDPQEVRPLQDRAAYAELAAARAAVSSARAAGVDVFSHAARIEALAVQLAGAG